MPVAGAPGILKCRSCAFIFAPEIQSEDAKLYDSNFGDTNVHPTYEKRGGKYVVRNRARLEALLDRMEPFRGEGRILDIGCSAAFLLSVAKERGWQPQGVEIAPWAAEFSRKELGIDVFNGMLEDARFPDNHFDVVFSSHVMEHIGQPLGLLSEMVRVLRPGGAHVTVVPTQFASPSWRLQRRFIGDPPPIHASFYTRETYGAFLKKAGLTVQSIQYNVELTRLRDMARSEATNLRSWQQQKNAIVQGQAADAATARPAWLGAAKAVVNGLGNFLGMGDEIIAIAVKGA
ncbi:MAG: methyltransferase domain-containing protein [Prosthecobacter sp.]